MQNFTGYVIKQLVHVFSCALSTYGALGFFFPRNSVLRKIVISTHLRLASSRVRCLKEMLPHFAPWSKFWRGIDRDRCSFSCFPKHIPNGFSRVLRHSKRIYHSTEPPNDIGWTRLNVVREKDTCATILRNISIVRDQFRRNTSPDLTWIFFQSQVR